MYWIGTLLHDGRNTEVWHKSYGEKDISDTSAEGNQLFLRSEYHSSLKVFGFSGGGGGYAPE